jgi:hypothetical protein
VFHSGRLTVDLARRLVEIEGKPVKLTTTECAFLRLLVQHAGKVPTHRHILREVWGPRYLKETQYLHVYVAQLRKKLEADPANSRLYSQSQARVTGWRSSLNTAGAGVWNARPVRGTTTRAQWSSPTRPPQRRSA